MVGGAQKGAGNGGRPWRPCATRGYLRALASPLEKGSSPGQAAKREAQLSSDGWSDLGLGWTPDPWGRPLIPEGARRPWGDLGLGWIPDH